MGVDLYTSPIPEEAPVMRTTLPATSSLKMYLTMERKKLKNRKGGKKNRREKKVKVGAATFKNM